MTALEILHIVTPAVLALPVLGLLPTSTTAPGDIPGIRAVTVKTVTPRRGLILLFLTLLAATCAYEAALLCIDLVVAGNDRPPIGIPERPRNHYHSDFWVYATGAHALGGLVVYALAAILAEWRMRWGDKGLVLLAMLAFGLEVPNLVLSVITEVHASGPHRIFSILALPPSILRLLLLPVLAVLILNPIVRFETADERTGLLNGDLDGNDSEEAASSTGRAAGRLLPKTSQYGTFDAGSSAAPSDAARSQAGTPVMPVPGSGSGGAAEGTATPSGINKKQIVIPKKLGQKVEETQGISWSAFWSRMRKLWPHLWPSTSWRLQLASIFCVCLLVLGMALNPQIPAMLAELIDRLSRVEHGQPTQSIWPPFIGYIGLRAIQGGGLLGFLQNIAWVPVQQYADREMQMLCFNHLLNLSLAFHTRRNTGEVLKIIDRGSAINNLFQILLFSAVPTIGNIIIAVIFLNLRFGNDLSLLLAAIMLTYVTFSIVFTSYRTKLRRQMIDRDVKTRGIASDVLTNWESVKYFTAEHRESARFDSSILAFQETEYKVLISFNLLNLTQAAIITIGLLTGSLIIANRVLRGEATSGDFVYFIQYLQQLYAPLDRLGTLYRQLNANSTDAEKLFKLLGEPTEIQDKPGAKDLVVTDGVIEFDNVHFSYDGEVEALKGVSFRIGKGESMALVGESGSGKSTILRLLYRFYDIQSGAIRIDGQDISKVKQSSLRRAIGIVPQDSVLWNDTIGANISYGKEGSDDDDIIAAAKAARLHDRILSFPEGYSTVVGERGVRLSGGEKQRVSLARMFLKSPSILVLDEATSALDTETEREIQRSLHELARGRSSLSIAHRLSTIINSDQIVVMNDGRVIEHGSYHELVELDGHFAAMWKKQILTEEEMLALAEAPNAGTSAALELAKDAGALHIHRLSPPSTVPEHDEDGSAAAASGASTPTAPSPSLPTSPVAPGTLSYAEAVVAAPEDDEPEDDEDADEDKPLLAKRSKDSVKSAKATTDTESKPAPRPPSEGPPLTDFPALGDSSPRSSGGPPPMQRLASQTSTGGASAGESEDNSRSATPDAAAGKDGKRRKRLSSIKGFVRRMSDGGKSGGLVRRDSGSSK